jgi:Alpha-L-fucosidase
MSRRRGTPTGKFGIFIHWGAYSVPAFGNEWLLSSMAPRPGLFYGSVSSVRLVGRDTDVAWSLGPSGLEVPLPERSIEVGPFALKIEKGRHEG